jgi:nitroreductase
LSKIIEIIKQRQSDRLPYDETPLQKKDIDQIIEAAKWAPTAHNMQNFEVVLVDDARLLSKIGKITSHTSLTFLRENYRQMSFSKKELQRKKVGVLGSMFPPTWRDISKLRKASRKVRALSQTIQGSPVLLIVIFDPRKRAPASRGDFLGIVSLGCVMENMWLAAQSLGIGFQVMSVFSEGSVETKVKRVLKIPKDLKIAYAIRLGYSGTRPDYLRVRRDAKMFLHHNQYVQCKTNIDHANSQV